MNWFKKQYRTCLSLRGYYQVYYGLLSLQAVLHVMCYFALQHKTRILDYIIRLVQAVLIVVILNVFDYKLHHF